MLSSYHVCIPCRNKSSLLKIDGNKNACHRLIYKLSQVIVVMELSISAASLQTSKQRTTAQLVGEWIRR